MDQRTADVGYESDEPQDEQNDDYGPQYISHITPYTSLTLTSLQLFDTQASQVESVDFDKYATEYRANAARRSKVWYNDETATLGISPMTAHVAQLALTSL